MSQDLATYPSMFYPCSKRNDKKRMVSDLSQVKSVADSVEESRSHRLKIPWELPGQVVIGKMKSVEDRQFVEDTQFVEETQSVEK